MKTGQCATFGKRLAELRMKKGLTQAQLAETTQIQRVTIAKYEIGERAPSIDNLLSFVDFFGVSADYLLGLSEAENRNADKAKAAEYLGLSDKAVENLALFPQILNRRGERSKYYSNHCMPIYQTILNEILENEKLLVYFESLTKLTHETMSYRLQHDIFEVIYNQKYDLEYPNDKEAIGYLRYELSRLSEDIADSCDAIKNPNIYKILKNTPEYLNFNKSFLEGLEEAPDNGNDNPEDK